jgi:hydroxyacylglutathione hydrolase
MKTNNKTLSVIPVKLGIVKSFIIKGEKTAIVDTGYAGNGNKILCNLQENSIKPEDISLIVITHGHIDHYGSAEELRRLTGAPIAMHRADAEYVEKGINYIGTPVDLLGSVAKSLFIRTDKFVSKSLKVDIVFDDEVDLREFGINGRIIHTPGHTEGSISLIMSSGEAIIGDLLMGGILFKKAPRYPLFVSDIFRLRESIKRVIQLSPKIIYPSHGGPFTCDIVEKFLRKTSKI